MGVRVSLCTPAAMALQPLCLTLLTYSGSWAQELWVSQLSFVQGTEGGSVTLPCSYNSSQVPRLGSYMWVKEMEGARLEVSNGTQEFRGRVSWALDRSFLQGRRADIEIRELRPYDNGTYRCLVKIPPLGEGMGNGTWLQVVKAVPPVHSPAPPLSPLALGALIVGLGIAMGVVLILICYKRKRDRREVGPKTEVTTLTQDLGPELNYAEIRFSTNRRLANEGDHVVYSTIRGKGQG